MHLNDVMNEMGMTKPAFYRYFRNKDELVQEMIEQVLAMARENYIQLDDLTSGPESIFEKLTRTLLYNSDFMKNNLSRIHFMGYLFRKRKDVAVSINEINDKSYRTIAENLDIPLVAVHYMNAVFVLISFFSSGKRNIDNILDIYVKGFKGPEYDSGFSIGEIIEAADNTDFSSLFQDRMLMAVYEALLEEGDLVVSLGKVAEKAGMKKSSLYNYFSNKDEMLTKALFEKREIFNQIQEQFLSRYDRFGEKLFSYLALLYFFSVKYPRTIDIMEKLMSLDQFSRNKASFKKPHFDNFFVKDVGKAFDDGRLNSYGIDPATFLRFINVTMIMEMRYLKFINVNREEKKDYLVHMHNLFINGLNSLKEVV
jgi:AcrR family transcriptional regulator